MKKSAKTKTRTRVKPQNKAAKKSFHLRRVIFIFIVLSVACAAFLAGFILHKSATPKPPVLENGRNEMKRLPPDIKRELQYASPSATFRVPILMYHYVEYVQDKGDKIRQSLDIVPAVFENQIQTLQAAGYTFITAKDLGEVLDGKQQLPARPIILTFDDGYRDFYTDVYPILKAYNVKATEYVIPGFLDTNNFMYTKQVQEIATASGGLVDIGAHTVHHVWLKGSPYLIAKREIDDSKSMLEKITGQPVVSFAYPYGAFDKQALALAQDAGFSTAVTTIPGIDVSQNNRFFIYRIRPGARTGAALLNLLLQNSFKAF